MVASLLTAVVAVDRILWMGCEPKAVLNFITSTVMQRHLHMGKIKVRSLSIRTAALFLHYVMPSRQPTLNVRKELAVVLARDLCTHGQALQPGQGRFFSRTPSAQHHSLRFRNHHLPCRAQSLWLTANSDTLLIRSLFITTLDRTECDYLGL